MRYRSSLELFFSSKSRLFAAMITNYTKKLPLCFRNIMFHCVFLCLIGLIFIPVFCSGAHGPYTVLPFPPKTTLQGRQGWENGTGSKSCREFGCRQVISIGSQLWLDRYNSGISNGFIFKAGQGSYIFRKNSTNRALFNSLRGFFSRYTAQVLMLIPGKASEKRFDL